MFDGSGNEKYFGAGSVNTGCMWDVSWFKSRKQAAASHHSQYSLIYSTDPLQAEKLTGCVLFASEESPNQKSAEFQWMLKSAMKQQMIGYLVASWVWSQCLGGASLCFRGSSTVHRRRVRFTGESKLPPQGPIAYGCNAETANQIAAF